MNIRYWLKLLDASMEVMWSWRLCARVPDLRGSCVLIWSVVTECVCVSAVDRCVTASLSDARDALINAAIDSLASYRSSVLTVPQPGLLAPACLRLLPLYILALLKHVRHTLHTRSTSWPCSNTYDILTHSLYILALLKHVRHTLHTHTLALHPGPAQTRTTHATHSLYILALLKHVRHRLHTHTLALHPGPAQTRTTHTTYSHTRSTSWPRSNMYNTHYILTHSLYILAPLKHVTTHATYSHTRSTSWPRSNTYNTHYTLALHPGPAQTRTTHATYSHTRSTSWPRSNTYDTHYILTHSLYILALLKHVHSSTRCSLIFSECVCICAVVRSASLWPLLLRKPSGRAAAGWTSVCLPCVSWSSSRWSSSWWWCFRACTAWTSSRTRSAVQSLDHRYMTLHQTLQTWRVGYRKHRFQSRAFDETCAFPFCVPIPAFTFNVL